MDRPARRLGGSHGLWPVSYTHLHVCPICHGVGYVQLDVSLGHPQFGKAVPCVCTRKAIQERRLARLRETSNLQHMQKMTFDTFCTDTASGSDISAALQDALNTARAFAHHPRGWLVLIGAYGCGKTHLAAAVANYCIEGGRPVLFVIVPDLLDYLRAAYAPNSPTT